MLHPTGCAARCTSSEVIQDSFFMETSKMAGLQGARGSDQAVQGGKYATYSLTKKGMHESRSYP